MADRPPGPPRPSGPIGGKPRARPKLPGSSDTHDHFIKTGTGTQKSEFYSTKREGEDSDSGSDSGSGSDRDVRATDSEDEDLLASADEDHRHFLARTRDQIARSGVVKDDDASDISTDSDADIEKTDFRPSKATKARARVASAGRQRPPRQQQQQPQQQPQPLAPMDPGRPDLAGGPRGKPDLRPEARLNFRPTSAGTDASEPEVEGGPDGGGGGGGGGGLEPEVEHEPVAGVTDNLGDAGEDQAPPAWMFKATPGPRPSYSCWCSVLTAAGALVLGPRLNCCCWVGIFETRAGEQEVPAEDGRAEAEREQEVPGAVHAQLLHRREERHGVLQPRSGTFPCSALEPLSSLHRAAARPVRAGRQSTELPVHRARTLRTPPRPRHTLMPARVGQAGRTGRREARSPPCASRWSAATAAGPARTSRRGARVLGPGAVFRVVRSRSDALLTPPSPGPGLQVLVCPAEEAGGGRLVQAGGHRRSDHHGQRCQGPRPPAPPPAARCSSEQDGREREEIPALALMRVHARTLRFL